MFIEHLVCIKILCWATQAFQDCVKKSLLSKSQQQRIKYIQIVLNMIGSDLGGLGLEGFMGKMRVNICLKGCCVGFGSPGSRSWGRISRKYLQGVREWDVDGVRALKERFQEGGSGWGTHVNPWLIHVNVWQKPLQSCKVISLQLIKINEKKNKREISHVPNWGSFPLRKSWESLGSFSRTCQNTIQLRVEKTGVSSTDCSLLLIKGCFWERYLFSLLLLPPVR